MSEHREVPIKVTAWVDEGIAPLVLALNGLPDVLTLDSCQGDEGGRPASVFFCHRGTSMVFAPMVFAAQLAGVLAPIAPRCDYTLRVEWRAEGDGPVFRLVCPAAHAKVLAEAVRAWALAEENS